MKVLIVARTRMGEGAYRCIGGITEDNQAVRLLTETGDYPSDTSPLKVGEIWEAELRPVQDVVPPHVENVRTLKPHRVDSQPNLDLHLRSRVQPWRGELAQVFDSLVRFTGNGNGYICERIGVPDHSTCFWCPDRSLVLRNDGKHFDYQPGICGLSYVGERPAPAEISAGTLVRVSLATWWKPDGADDFEERCYLQLSEWYD